MPLSIFASTFSGFSASYPAGTGMNCSNISVRIYLQMSVFYRFLSYRYLPKFLECVIAFWFHSRSPKLLFKMFNSDSHSIKSLIGIIVPSVPIIFVWREHPIFNPLFKPHTASITATPITMSPFCRPHKSAIHLAAISAGRTIWYSHHSVYFILFSVTPSHKFNPF